MPESLISPSRYVTQDGAVRGVGGAAARLGSRVAVIAGETGVRPVAADLESSLREAGAAAVWLRHRGPCSLGAASRLAEAVSEAGCEVVVGVGGGRALDVTKWVAELADVPFVLVPTSPATCAAATAIVVEYSEEGVYQRGRLVERPAAYTFVDPGVLAAAPDRLLVAGVVDALAKVVEVRFSASRQPAPSAALVAAVELCDALERELFEGSRAVFGSSARHDGGAARRRLAEVVVLWPGIVGALASEEAKLAAAHPVYNALTLLPGCRSYLHGEVMALGVLTQYVLEGRDAGTVERAASLFALIGCPAGLAAVGCEAYLGDGEARRAVLERACTMPSLRAGFPHVGPEALGEALARADELARAALSPA